MTLYSFVLFIHVVSAMGLFVGLALEGFVSLRFRVAQDAEQLQLFIRAFNLLRWIFIPSFGGILLGGLYLASKYGGGTFWIPGRPNRHARYHVRRWAHHWPENKSAKEDAWQSGRSIR